VSAVLHLPAACGHQIEQITARGFDRAKAIKALKARTEVEQAIEWLFTEGGSESPGGQSNASTGSGGLRVLANGDAVAGDAAFAADQPSWDDTEGTFRDIGHQGTVLCKQRRRRRRQ